MSVDDARHMAHALALGRRGLGRQSPYPWPSVGCVLVKDGRVVGRGTTDAATLRHAERVALDRAGRDANGSTAYVTLEPCTHHGNTPPCADALIAAGVARVVIAATDPNPKAAGGAERLRSAGIEVVTDVLAKQAIRDHAGFLLVQRENRPFVTLKLAASLDGRIATATGESQWITGPEARRAVHAMRANHDAVMIGGGTARTDDPQLTVRGMGASRQPVRVVLSRRLDLPLDGALMRAAGEVPVWLIHQAGVEADPFVAAGARAIPCDVSAGQIDPGAALRALAEGGITRVFCEGGGSLAASLLSAGLVDQLVVFHAGLAIGAEGTPALSAMGIVALADAPRFELIRHQQIGGDTMSIWGGPNF